jgi:hypothetical protein
MFNPNTQKCNDCYVDQLKDRDNICHFCSINEMIYNGACICKAGAIRNPITKICEFTCPPSYYIINGICGYCVPPSVYSI